MQFIVYIKHKLHNSHVFCKTNYSDSCCNCIKSSKYYKYRDSIIHEPSIEWLSKNSSSSLGASLIFTLSFQHHFGSRSKRHCREGCKQWWLGGGNLVVWAGPCSLISLIKIYFYSAIKKDVSLYFCLCRFPNFPISCLQTISQALATAREHLARSLLKWCSRRMIVSFRGLDSNESIDCPSVFFESNKSQCFHHLGLDISFEPCLEWKWWILCADMHQFVLLVTQNNRVPSLGRSLCRLISHMLFSVVV